MRLYNGYRTKTAAKSYAWLALDTMKLSKLDESSEMEIRKSGKHLELLLESGNLFFNVSEPLKPDEAMTIRTSTMAIGIRGTSGWVNVIDTQTTSVSLLTGKVECSITDLPSGSSGPSEQTRPAAPAKPDVPDEPDEPEPVTCTVTFDSQGGSSAEAQTVEEGKPAAKPSSPTRSGYTFGGWYTDEALTSAYDFSAPVTQNITLYAKWTRNAPPPPATFTITLDKRDSTPAETLTVGRNGIPDLPGPGSLSHSSEPTWYFEGWYSDADCTYAYEASPVTRDLTLYALWLVDFGSCGTGTAASPSWELYSNGKLTIDGTGAMNDYAPSSTVPWNSLKSTI